MNVRRIVCLVLICLYLGGCASWHRKDYSKPLEPGQVALKKITDPARMPDFRYRGRRGLDSYRQEGVLPGT